MGVKISQLSQQRPLFTIFTPGPDTAKNSVLFVSYLEKSLDCDFGKKSHLYNEMYRFVGKFQQLPMKNFLTQQNFLL